MELKRTVGLPGAVLMGLGSILGTGVFVTLGLVAGEAGDRLPWVVAGAAFLALCNGLSSAQLAAAHPVSGGTYEYGYQFLHPWAGYLAGWFFLCAKTASASAAALGFGGYLLQAFPFLPGSPIHWAVGGMGVVTALVLGGLRRSSWMNGVLVSVTLFALGAFVVWVMPHGGVARTFDPVESPSLWEPMAWMFVAYTGYGRIATLGEEVKNPRRTIPLAMAATLGVSFAVYLAVGMAALGAVGGKVYGQWAVETAAPLGAIAASLGYENLERLLGLGAACALLGVVLNLVLGLSRVVFQMARRGDLPVFFAGVSGAPPSPRRAEMAVAVGILGFVLLGSLRGNWAFSALTVLVYYAFTNLAALRLGKSQRMFHPLVSVAGLVGCAFLTAWIDGGAWILGALLAALGIFWRMGYRGWNGRKNSP